MLLSNSMRGLSPSLSVKILFTALFLWVQGASLFDAAAHGDEPHEHYGVSCELTVAVKAKVATLPAAPALPKPPRVFILADRPVLEFRPWSQPPGRGPPPRGPPAFNQ